MRGHRSAVPAGGMGENPANYVFVDGISGRDFLAA
jgi:hypothetical protein